ncbi:MAG: four helix bundle protein [Candidatus Doudnabacteria bacterium]|nr:four helix bundle protein [Candidatus Doudnabacteria bacterium]
MKSYKDLIAWQKAIALVKEIYKIVGRLPKQETYILSAQMLRAAISIPSNIAEGSRRNHKAEYIQFLSIATASAAELETQIIIAKNQYPSIGYSVCEGLTNEVQKMLYVIINKLKSNQNI